VLFKDAFRAQYFIAILEKKLEELSSVFSKSSVFFHASAGQVLADFLTGLAFELDQLILPIIAYEVSLASAHRAVTCLSTEKGHFCNQPI